MAVAMVEEVVEAPHLRQAVELEVFGSRGSDSRERRDGDEEDVDPGPEGSESVERSDDLERFERVFDDGDGGSGLRVIDIGDLGLIKFQKNCSGRVLCPNNEMIHFVLGGVVEIIGVVSNNPVANTDSD
jgi:hypothetical protein